MDLNLRKSLILNPLNCPTRIFARIRTGIIHRLLNRYVDITSLVITYHPIVEMSMVDKSAINDDLRDFLTYCFVKKSPKAAIEIVASGGIYSIFSNVSPKRFIIMKKVIRERVSIQ